LPPSVAVVPLDELVVPLDPELVVPELLVPLEPELLVVEPFAPLLLLLELLLLALLPASRAVVPASRAGGRDPELGVDVMSDALVPWPAPSPSSPPPPSSEPSHTQSSNANPSSLQSLVPSSRFWQRQ
jgi:hypothetical protein